MLATIGCGGGGSNGTNPALGSPAGLPVPGNYEGPITTIGTVNMNVSSTGTLSIAVVFSATPGTYAGSTTIGTNDTYSTLLTNTSNGQTTVASGTTHTNAIGMSLTGGSLAAKNDVATPVTANLVR